MLSIFNTLSRQKEVFKPLEPNKVRMYVCGMTVYDYCHLGHARMMVVFDMVARWLRASGYELTYVRNITDIDDKIIRRAAEHGEPIQTLTARYINALHEDCTALGILPPDHEPRATACVGDMTALIERLIAKGHAYVASNGDVYYSVHTFTAYGKLSGKSIKDLRAGERVEIDPHKRDPLDFVLWKRAKPGEPSWESPWGSSGRPGWHIECSAMSCRYLGERFDIHGGGADLQFPHHENEIAQSEGASGTAFVNYWMHNGFIRVDNEKMSKSLGNFLTIRDVLKNYDAEVVRFFLLRAHYRSPLMYSDVHLNDAKAALTRLYTALKQVPPLEGNVGWTSGPAQHFKRAMDDDFNTAEAIAVLFELAGDVNRTGSREMARELKGLGAYLGLLERSAHAFLQRREPNETNEEDNAIEALIHARTLARTAKDWAESDRIRDQLIARGILVEDTPHGTSWRRV